MTKPIDAIEIGRLLGEHAPALELYAGQWVATAEDCVQEAFIELASQAARPPEPIAWLYRVVRNRALNANRSARRRTNHERLAAMLCQSFGEFDVGLDDEKASLEQSLDRLDNEERELVVLRIWSGLNWQQIAEVTGTSSSNAHRRYVAVLKNLKELLEPSCPKNMKSRTN